LQLHVLHAATEAEIEAAFAGFAQLRAGVIGAALFSMPKAGCSLSFRRTLKMSAHWDRSEANGAQSK
jgi:hypothetical protein